MLIDKKKDAENVKDTHKDIKHVFCLQSRRAILHSDIMSVKSSTTRGKVPHVQSRPCIGDFFVWPSSESKSATLRVRFFAAADAIRTAIIRVFG